ncbi:S8 family serine peptidase [Hymenobacter sp. BRD128]|uniref:S8 family peptidase n=1 Tax=Hymenobacter sp. BRD128 TaxID=2675878 RepID=UPI001563C2EC|nr:S8 family peptidase [Hymenobacter sp. BRD128]QKG56297.1 S8 family serine peptidase [Hymenobacter sp. BRD128]
MRLFYTLLGFVCWLLALPGLAGPPTVPGRLVLKLHAEAGSAAAGLGALRPALAALHATSITQKFPLSQLPNTERPGSVNLRQVYELTVPASLALAKARAQLLATGVVEYVEPLYIREPQYQPNDPLADSTAANNQYHLRLTQAYRAWDFTKGDTSIVIGMTDTGIRYTHEELLHQVKYNYADPINGKDDDGDGYVDNFRGWDFSNNNNDPMYEAYTGHGTQASSIVAGQADNGKGLAGVGFKSKFLPLQVFPGTPTGSFAGYEAIVYAADHGCRVINMSWGGAGGYSRFEQDVCTYAAVNRDAVLVAAAGNTSGDILFYPASYDHVLSVSATDATDSKASFATYSRRIDLVAPGVNIAIAYGRPTTTAAGPPDTDYWHGSGTSFAAPQVAGAAALVRARFPQLTAEQVMAQLRRTADASIYALAANGNYQGYLGTGRLNIARAVAGLSQREARVVRSAFSPVQPAGYAPGDTIRLATTVRNLLLPVGGLTVTLRSLSPYLTVRRGTFAAGNLATLNEASNDAAPFRLAVAGTVPLNTTATLNYHLVGDNGYVSDQYVDVLLNPDYVQLDAGNISLSLTSRGNLAYDDPTAAVGRGLSYRGSTPLLSEGGLLLATSPTRVADHLRASPGTVRQSFFTLAQVRRLAPGPRADQEARGVFRDSLPDAKLPRSVGVRVRQRGQSWASPAARRNVILLDYSLRNLTADTLKPLYAGLFADWDLPGEAARNVARWDSVSRMGYCYDPLAPRFYAGVQVLGPRPTGIYSIDNAAPVGTPIYLGDGFSPAEKYLALRDGFGRAHRQAGTDAQGSDVSQVVSTLVPRLAPGDSATVAFAVLVAPTLAELQAAAKAATAAYQQPLAAVPVAAGGTWQLYPNPTTGRLHVALPASLGPATVQVLDALGQTVSSAGLPSGGGELDLASLSRGLYIVRVVGTSLVQRVVRE